MIKSLSIENCLMNNLYIEPDYIDVGDQKFISLNSVGLGFMYRLLEDDGFGSRFFCSLSDNSSWELALCEKRLDNIHDEPCLSPGSSWNGAVK